MFSMKATFLRRAFDRSPGSNPNQGFRTSHQLDGMGSLRATEPRKIEPGTAGDSPLIAAGPARGVPAG